MAKEFYFFSKSEFDIKLNVYLLKGQFSRNSGLVGEKERTSSQTEFQLTAKETMKQDQKSGRTV